MLHEVSDQALEERPLFLPTRYAGETLELASVVVEGDDDDCVPRSKLGFFAFALTGALILLRTFDPEEIVKTAFLRECAVVDFALTGESEKLKSSSSSPMLFFAEIVF